jgi:acyl-CoA synthetase (AMP-forming)/AMP-acid ligase II
MTDVAPERADLAFGTIPRMVRAAATRFGDTEGLVDGDLRLTFAELSERVDEAGRAFLAAGLEPGDRVAIWAPNIAEWVFGALGALAAGGVIVPLNTRFKGAEAAYVLGRSRARMLLCVNGFLGNDYVAALRATGEQLPSLERIVVLRGEAPEGTQPWADFASGASAVSPAALDARVGAGSPDDLSDIIFTSGTTGRPKGVMVSHAQTLRVFWDWSGIVGLSHGDRYLIVNPFFHTFGYKAGILACLLRGATIIPEPVFDVPAVLQRVSDERVTMLPGPPTLYLSILNHPDRDRYDLSSLRLAVTGAAAVPVEMIRRMRSELTFRTIITGYGLTESTGTVTMCRPDDDPETIATTSGRAIHDTEVRVVDDDGHEVPRGTPGEIVCRGYHVMLGYFEDPEATAEAIDADGWLHTGDLGVMDERGYVDITDRKKDMFIVGGFNAYPAEIENALLGHEAVAQVAVVGVPDARMGEVGHAFVVPRPGTTVDPDALIAWCRERMANYKVPRAVHVVDALPVNASGKVLKYELRARASS